MNKLFRKALMFISLLMACGVLAIMVLSYRSVQQIPSKNEEEIVFEVKKKLHFQEWQNLQAIKFTAPDGMKYQWHKPTNTLRVDMSVNYIILRIRESLSPILVSASRTFTPAELMSLQKQWRDVHFRLFGYFTSFDAETTKHFIPAQEHIKIRISGTETNGYSGSDQIWTLNRDTLPNSCLIADKETTADLQFSWSRWQTLPSGMRLATCYSENGLQHCFTNISMAAQIDTSANQ